MAEKRPLLSETKPGIKCWPANVSRTYLAAWLQKSRSLPNRAWRSSDVGAEASINCLLPRRVRKVNAETGEKPNPVICHGARRIGVVSVLVSAVTPRWNEPRRATGCPNWLGSQAPALVS